MDESKRDDLKGRAKEAMGAVRDDDELRREGRADQKAAAAKRTVDEIADRAQDAVDKFKNAATHKD
jgi:uncharacterized protein YjbJ (UPF0337 family)